MVLSIMSSHVSGFRPFRSAFCFTQSLPKLAIRTSSPNSSDCLINYGNISTVAIDFLLVHPFLSAAASIVLALVGVADNGMVEISVHSEASD